MMKNRKVLSLIFASFSVVLSFGALFVAPPKAEAVRLEKGCYISANNASGAPEWTKDNGCTFLKKVYESQGFNPDSTSCYISWATIYGPTPPIKAVSCTGAEGDDSYIPQPGGPAKYPFNNVPGAAEAVNINPNEVNCFVEDPTQGYRKVECPPNNNDAGCYVVISGVGVGGVSTVGARIPDCNTIQNAVIEGTQNNTAGQYEAPLAQADECGATDQAQVKLSINIGCQARGNPIVDMVFAFTRFLSVGAGIVCVASMIVGAIQFTASGGNPKATADAVKRMVSSVGALVFFLFIYAILNWIIPGGIN